MLSYLLKTAMIAGGTRSVAAGTITHLLSALWYTPFKPAIFDIPRSYHRNDGRLIKVGDKKIARMLY